MEHVVLYRGNVRKHVKRKGRPFVGRCAAQEPFLLVGHIIVLLEYSGKMSVDCAMRTGGDTNKWDS
jgi:hypothetical protein